MYLNVDIGRQIGKCRKCFMLWASFSADSNNIILSQLYLIIHFIPVFLCVLNMDLTDNLPYNASDLQDYYKQQDKKDTSGSFRVPMQQGRSKKIASFIATKYRMS